MMYFYPAPILLPNSDIDLKRWSVVACDQYTSQPEYWSAVQKQVAQSPSTLQLIFPEAYLSRGQKEERIHSINATMQQYRRDGIFQTLPSGYILLERTLPNGHIRRGLIGCIDLEDYEYLPGEKPLIRATEGTVLERIPPRVEIRKEASLELPHIMLLIDDPQKTVIEPLFSQTDTVCYDFDLMQNGGHVKGYVLSEKAAKAIQEHLAPLADANRYEKDGAPFLFAVGDGNHSLATAKTCWQQLKNNLSDEEQKTHPSRFALVELVNLHDSALVFEPIHRIVTNCNPSALLEQLKQFAAQQTGNRVQTLTLCLNGEQSSFTFPHATDPLTVGTLQRFLDETGEGEVDYIHGADVVLSLSKDPHAVGFLLPAMDKNDLFASVVLGGALPRKTFSMGEAHEKRYYLEARSLY